MPISDQCLFNLFLKAFTDEASITCCDKLLHIWNFNTAKFLDTKMQKCYQIHSNAAHKQTANVPTS